MWEVSERRLITWEDSYCSFIFQSLSHDCRGKCKPDRFTSLEDVNCKAFALSSKNRENERETSCMCYQISILLNWSNDKTLFAPQLLVLICSQLYLHLFRGKSRHNTTVLVTVEHWFGSRLLPAFLSLLQVIAASQEIKQWEIRSAVFDGIVFAFMWKKCIPTSLLAIHMNYFHTPTSLLKSVTYTLHCNWQTEYMWI